MDTVSNVENTNTSEAETEESEEGESQLQIIPSKGVSQTCNSNEQTIETEIEEGLTDLELD